MTQTQTGTVKWFDNKKGYGFITPENGDKDLFVHMSSIMMEGYKTLTDNQKVSYEVGTSDRGPVATNVTVQENKMPRGRRKYNVKPTLHDKKYNRYVCGKYSLIKGTKIYEYTIPLKGEQGLNNVNFYNLIASHRNVNIENIVLEDEPYIVTNYNDSIEE